MGEDPLEGKSGASSHGNSSSNSMYVCMMYIFIHVFIYLVFSGTSKMCVPLYLNMVNI